MIQINNQIAGCAIATLVPENRRLMITNESAIKMKIYEVIDQHNYLNIIIDMKCIDIIDSTGLGSLISICNHGRNNNCKVKFCNLNESVAKVITISQLDQVLDINTSLETAIATL